ncbi:MAG: hypothetical protein ACW964_03510 [Candidatus Hodarchaeales archaeon]|jgi:hypothetical protein
MNSLFPDCLAKNSYGTTLFWIEEYWTTRKILELERKYPNIDFSGIIDPYFKNMMSKLLHKPPHIEILGTNQFSDFSKIVWEENRRYINIATSHAPSRFIASNYAHRLREKCRIITIDAHLDISNTNFIHNSWIDTDLMTKTALIGGWGEVTADINYARDNLAFIEPSVDKIIQNPNFREWISGKKIYLTIDLDYFRLSQHRFMGYSNYWHRNRIIGHSMNVEQILEEYITQDNKSDKILLGEMLGVYSDLESFIQDKKKSLRNQSGKIEEILRTLVNFCRNNYASFLSIDFVEYSPICDYHQLTIREFERNYQIFFSILSTVREDRIS